MTRSLLKKLLIAAFLTAFVILLGSFNVSKPRIMVLHSFSHDMPWCRDVDAGIQKVLKKNRQPVTVKWHYLDLDSNQQGDHVSNAVAGAERAISQMNPDLLIAVDDESNKYLASRYVGQGKPKVLFVAILQPPKLYGYERNVQASGIVEQLPLEAVRDALLTARQGKPARIAVLAMDDVTGRAEQAQVTSFNWGPHRLAALHASNSFAEWQAFTTRMSGQADVLLVMSYGGLKRGEGNRRELPRQEIATWLEKNAGPLPLGICETYVEDGGGLGITPAPVDFGEQAMTMALTWIQAPKGKGPPAVTASPHFRVGLRSSVLAARGVSMPAIYVEAARIGDAYFP